MYQTPKKKIMNVTNITLFILKLFDIMFCVSLLINKIWNVKSGKAYLPKQLQLADHSSLLVYWREPKIDTNKYIFKSRKT